MSEITDMKCALVKGQFIFEGRLLGQRPSLIEFSNVLQQSGFEPRLISGSEKRENVPYVFDGIGVLALVGNPSGIITALSFDFEYPDWRPLWDEDPKGHFAGDLEIDGIHIRRGLRYLSVEGVMPSKSGLIEVCIIGNRSLLQSVRFDFPN